jgi:hypothetical protein
MSTTEPTVRTLVKDILDGLAALVTGHFKLLRAELGADARELGRRALLVTLAVALMLLGYGLGCVAGALALAPVMGAPLAFLAIGAAHVLGGGLWLRAVLARAPSPPLGATRAELDQTVAALARERSLAHVHH